jgi:hypothetical protein
MIARASGIALMGAALTAFLVGCTAAPPSPVTTPGPTVTVTTTATQDPAEPLSVLGAWSVCYGFLTRYVSSSDTTVTIPQLRSYDPKWVTQAGDAFQVSLSPDGTGWGCTVTGTVAAPQITEWTSVP